MPILDFQSKFSTSKIIWGFPFFSLKNTNLGAHFLITSTFKSLYFLKWCPIFDTSPSTQFSNSNNFLWFCVFLGKNLFSFLPPVWKHHNPYCHNVYMYYQNSLWEPGSHNHEDPLQCTCNNWYQIYLVLHYWSRPYSLTQRVARCSRKCWKIGHYIPKHWISSLWHSTKWIWNIGLPMNFFLFRVFYIW